MNNKSVFLNNEVIGEVSSYAALPTVNCPQCGAKLHRLFKSETQWQFVCLDDSVLVAPGTDEPVVEVQIK